MCILDGHTDVLTSATAIVWTSGSSGLTPSHLDLQMTADAEVLAAGVAVLRADARHQ
jgi:hypothetical protein